MELGIMDHLERFGLAAVICFILFFAWLGLKSKFGKNKTEKTETTPIPPATTPEV